MRILDMQPTHRALFCFKKLRSGLKYLCNGSSSAMILHVSCALSPAARSRDEADLRRGGSTIGPMLSAALGTRTLDLGNAQLSMHSIRETGGVFDVDYSIKLFESFFQHYSELETKILVD